MKIDTKDVLKAASTKWNFLNFEPGLVGGHCIGVDPYYLTYQSKNLAMNLKLYYQLEILTIKYLDQLLIKLSEFLTRKK